MQVWSLSWNSDIATLLALNGASSCGPHGSQPIATGINVRTILAAADERHLGCHDSQKLDVSIEWQTGHVDHRVSHMAEVEGWLRGNHTTGLWHSLFHLPGQLGSGIADVDL